MAMVTACEDQPGSGKWAAGDPWGLAWPLAGNITKWRAWGGIWGDIWGGGVLPQHKAAHLSAFSWSTVADGNPGLRFSPGGGGGPTAARDARGPRSGRRQKQLPQPLSPRGLLAHAPASPPPRRQASVFSRGSIHLQFTLVKPVVVARWKNCETSQNMVTPKRSPIPIGSRSHPRPQHLTTTNPLPASMDVPVLDVSQRWSHTPWGPCLASLAERRVFEVRPRCGESRRLPLFRGRVTLRCMDGPRFIQFSAAGHWAHSCLLPFD